MNHSVHDITYRNAVWMSTCSCILSILGSFAIFGSYILIPDIRNSSRKLVTCLTVADFLTALGYLISALAYFDDTTDVCTTQSVITTYSSLVSFYLTAAIAIHIFATVIYKNSTTSSWKYLLCANVISWLIPGIIVGVAGADKVLGSTQTFINLTDPSNATVGTGPWCWLKLHHKRYYMWMFLSGKGWEFLCYLITTCLYVLLKFYLYLHYRRHSLKDIHQCLREDDQNYLYVWFVLYVLRLWGSIRAILFIFCDDPICKKISDIFMYMQAVGDPGQAFCNFILFCCLDRTVRTALFKSCHGNSYNSVSQRERERLIPGVRNNNPTSQRKRKGPITGRDNYAAHSTKPEETSDEGNGQDNFQEQLGKSSSFDKSQKDKGAQRIRETSDDNPKNVSVQSKSSTSKDGTCG